MKMDFQGRLFAVAITMGLSGCGQAVNNASGFQELNANCTGSALPQQFIVKHTDGTMEVVRAADEATFRSGYMIDNAANIQYAEHDFLVDTKQPVHALTDGQTMTSADNWGVIKIETGNLWSQNIRGSGVIVAVVDSGMDFTHPQLAQQVYINPGETGTDSAGRNKATNGIDDDGNGYIDDHLGYDFVANRPLQGDYQYHGTHVSGIIAAQHSDTAPAPKPYVQGVAPGVKLMPLAFLNAQGSGAMSDGVRAIQYAVAQGAKVINASWGGTQCSQALKDQIAALATQNVIFVTAAGNEAADVDTSPEYPASLNLLTQFTIGATGDHDYMADYSNYGVKTVHMFAPGTDITSTLPGAQMGVLSGTSMATPFVSGSIALLLSAVPTATPSQIRSALYSTAMHNSDYLNVSQGRIDLGQVLTQLQSIIAASTSSNSN